MWTGRLANLSTISICKQDKYSSFCCLTENSHVFVLSFIRLNAENMCLMKYYLCFKLLSKFELQPRLFHSSFVCYYCFRWEYSCSKLFLTSLACTMIHEEGNKKKSLFWREETLPHLSTSSNHIRWFLIKQLSRHLWTTGSRCHGPPGARSGITGGDGWGAGLESESLA